MTITYTSDLLVVMAQGVVEEERRSWQSVAGECPFASADDSHRHRSPIFLP